MQRLFSMQDKEIASCTMADFLQFFCDDKEIVDEILLCIKILPENLSEIFWLKRKMDLRKIKKRFHSSEFVLSKESLQKQLSFIHKIIDKARTKGIISKNAASRKISDG